MRVDAVRRWLPPLAIVLAGLLEPGATRAADRTGASSVDVHGHLKLQLSARRFPSDDLAATLGRDLDDASIDARLNLEAHPGRWRLVAHLQVLGAGGDSLRLLRDPAIAELAGQALTVPPSDDPRAWLDLDRTLTDSGSRRLVARLDRLSVGYTGDHLVLRLGRQALSWGNGLVFNVLDLFDPFPPNAADTECKPGTDMLWGQWLLASGDDLQALIVPRRDPATGDLSGDQGSLAAKWHHFGKSFELELMAAEHYDDQVFGLGLSRNLAGGVLRFDLTTTRLESGRNVVSAVVNLDHSSVWAGRNVYAFVELHRNGFGSTSFDEGVGGLDPALRARLERGEVFAVGRDEAAVGAQIEVTPLTSLDPTLIANVRDGSGLGLVRIRRELSDELRLEVGLQVPWGGRGSEYGGLSVMTGSLDGRTTSSGSWLWVRLSRYF